MALVTADDFASDNYESSSDEYGDDDFEGSEDDVEALAAALDGPAAPAESSTFRRPSKGSQKSSTSSRGRKQHDMERRNSTGVTTLGFDVADPDLMAVEDSVPTASARNLNSTAGRSAATSAAATSARRSSSPSHEASTTGDADFAGGELGPQRVSAPDVTRGSEQAEAQHDSSFAASNAAAAMIGRGSDFAGGELAAPSPTTTDDPTEEEYGTEGDSDAVAVSATGDAQLTAAVAAPVSVSGADKAQTQGHASNHNTDAGGSMDDVLADILGASDEDAAVPHEGGVDPGADGVSGVPSATGVDTHVDAGNGVSLQAAGSPTAAKKPLDDEHAAVHGNIAASQDSMADALAEILGDTDDDEVPAGAAEAAAEAMASRTSGEGDSGSADESSDVIAGGDDSDSDSDSGDEEFEDGFEDESEGDDGAIGAKKGSSSATQVAELPSLGVATASGGSPDGPAAPTLDAATGEQEREGEEEQKTDSTGAEEMSSAPEQAAERSSASGVYGSAAVAESASAATTASWPRMTATDAPESASLAAEPSIGPQHSKLAGSIAADAAASPRGDGDGADEAHAGNRDARAADDFAAHAESDDEALAAILAGGSSAEARGSPDHEIVAHSGDSLTTAAAEQNAVGDSPLDETHAAEPEEGLIRDSEPLSAEKIGETASDSAPRIGDHGAAHGDDDRRQSSRGDSVGSDSDDFALFNADNMQASGRPAAVGMSASPGLENEPLPTQPVQLAAASVADESHGTAKHDAAEQEDGEDDYSEDYNDFENDENAAPHVSGAATPEDKAVQPPGVQGSQLSDGPTGAVAPVDVYRERSERPSTPQRASTEQDSVAATVEPDEREDSTALAAPERAVSLDVDAMEQGAPTNVAVNPQQAEPDADASEIDEYSDEDGFEEEVVEADDAHNVASAIPAAGSPAAPTSGGRITREAGESETSAAAEDTSERLDEHADAREDSPSLIVDGNEHQPADVPATTPASEEEEEEAEEENPTDSRAGTAHSMSGFHSTTSKLDAQEHSDRAPSAVVSSPRSSPSSGAGDNARRSSSALMSASGNLLVPLQSEDTGSRVVDLRKNKGPIPVGRPRVAAVERPNPTNRENEHGRPLEQKPSMRRRKPETGPPMGLGGVSPRGQRGSEATSQGDARPSSRGSVQEGAAVSRRTSMPKQRAEREFGEGASVASSCTSGTSPHRRPKMTVTEMVALKERNEKKAARRQKKQGGPTDDETRRQTSGMSGASPSKRLRRRRSSLTDPTASSAARQSAAASGSPKHATRVPATVAQQRKIREESRIRKGAPRSEVQRRSSTRLTREKESKPSKKQGVAGEARERGRRGRAWGTVQQRARRVPRRRPASRESPDTRAPMPAALEKRRNSKSEPTWHPTSGHVDSLMRVPGDNPGDVPDPSQYGEPKPMLPSVVRTRRRSTSSNTSPSPSGPKHRLSPASGVPTLPPVGGLTVGEMVEQAARAAAASVVVPPGQNPPALHVHVHVHADEDARSGGRPLPRHRGDKLNWPEPGEKKRRARRRASDVRAQAREAVAGADKGEQRPTALDSVAAEHPDDGSAGVEPSAKGAASATRQKVEHDLRAQLAAAGVDAETGEKALNAALRELDHATVGNSGARMTVTIQHGAGSPERRRVVAASDGRGVLLGRGIVSGKQAAAARAVLAADGQRRGKKKRKTKARRRRRHGVQPTALTPYEEGMLFFEARERKRKAARRQVLASFGIVPELNAGR